MPASASYGGIFDLPRLKSRLKEIQDLTEGSDFWKDAAAAKILMREKSILEKELKQWEELEKRSEELFLMYELLKEEEDASGDDKLGDELGRDIQKFQKEIDQLEIQLVLSGEKDINNAIVSIHPGAGGTESQDWAQMLMRMYLRWAEKAGYKTELLDLQAGEEAGIKDATFSVIGEYAYGKLKAEAGVHRLVRISPFDANKRRHTSFASVFVYPEIEDTELEVDEKEIKMEAFRSSGPGGQNVNKVSSAVRLTHIPTGITVACQTERSQHKNRSVAMKLLRAKLYELEQEKKEAEMNRLLSASGGGEKKDIAWGSQIRSYVFQPYQMVKDHRTNFEIGNVNAVMDGEVDPFIQAFLMQSIKPNR
jgi:peptide chain release factor 2